MPTLPTNLNPSARTVSGGSGMQGYTVTFANDYYAGQHPEYITTSMPMTLLYADGTTESLNMYDASALRGLTRNNVVAIKGDLWAAPYDEPNYWMPWVISLPGWNYEVEDSAEYGAAAVWMMGNGEKKYVFPLLGGTDDMYNGFYTTPGLWNTYMLEADTLVTHSNTGARCYLKGTLITLADGKQKPVEEIDYEDKLLVWDFDNGCHATAKPLWIKQAAKAPYYFKNTLASGKVLFTTGQSSTGWGHRMFDITKGAVRYTTESVSDMIMTLDGPEMHKSCERIDEECEYYNIITDYHMNLFANRILTSCSYNNLYPVKNMKFVKDDRTLRPFEAYDVPLKYYKGMRLAEQTMDVSEVNDYVSNLVKTEK